MDSPGKLDVLGHDGDPLPISVLGSLSVLHQSDTRRTEWDSKTEIGMFQDCLMNILYFKTGWWISWTSSIIHHPSSIIWKYWTNLKTSIFILPLVNMPNIIFSSHLKLVVWVYQSINLFTPILKIKNMFQLPSPLSLKYLIFYLSNNYHWLWLLFLDNWFI